MPELQKLGQASENKHLRMRSKGQDVGPARLMGGDQKDKGRREKQEGVRQPGLSTRRGM